MTALRAWVQSSLRRDEGLRLKPYLDCCGRAWRLCTCQRKGQLTIGFGTNLDAGIRDDEAVLLLDGRLDMAIADCTRAFPWFEALDPVRQGVLVQLCYALGLGTLLGFQQLLAAMKAGDYEVAAAALLDSRWHRQVGDRAVRLAEALRTGRVA